MKRRTLLTALAGSAVIQMPVVRAVAETAGHVSKITLIGATARSGREIITQGLEAGYRITGLARSPQKLDIENSNLTLVKGDVRDQASLEAALTGDEVVICMVGFPTPTDPTQEIGEVDLYTVMGENLIRAMEKQGNRRLLIASSTGVERRVTGDAPTGNDPSSMWRWNARHLYADMADMEDMVRDSGLDYVIFRPGFMVEEPARDDLQFNTTGDTPPARTITYPDFAEFVLDQVNSDEYLGRAVGIYSDTIMDPVAELKKYQEKMQQQAK